ncbi:DUF4232 domain-containing protein [Amnibacterium setariae]|uniref:DUF4232 domain-containing protein n=1 Tax=Amnibacterium setariae TaxID=2306585 RepID=A0A3A1U1J5_9MICO|nr:DUF4232 domain-containing protein [Amnibacterium setariae]RIX30210.1 DUF4232 domain-containing protein [Amnibacterium setariae]
MWSRRIDGGGRAARGAGAVLTTATLVTGLLVGAASGAEAAARVDPDAPYRQCADSAIATTVLADPEGSGAGQRLAHIVFENTGRSVCRLAGAPGVSLVSGGDGTRIGEPADRRQQGVPVQVMLRPGDAARADLQYTAVDEGGGPFDRACRAERADGYRISPPHSFRAVFVAAPQWACASSVHWGVAGYVDTNPVGEANGTRGCVNSRTVPAGAVVGATVDVDRDGLQDTQFTAAVGDRRVYGVRTGAGGVVTVTDPLRGVGVHGGWTANLDSAGGTITVLDDQRTARLYAFRGCRFVATTHRDGGAYAFTIGARTGSGTGVACNDRNGGTLLVRAGLRARSGGRFDVSWTLVDVSADGRTAVQRKDSKEVRWAGLKASDPRVAQARASSCDALLRVEARQD